MMWIGHLLWLVGRLYMNCFKGDVENIRESWLWIVIHMQKLTGMGRLPFKQRLNNLLIQFFGLLVTLLLIHMIVCIIKLIVLL